MALQFVERCRRCSKELTHRASLGLLRRNTVPVESGGAHDRRLGTSQNADREANARGNECDNQVSACDHLFFLFFLLLKVVLRASFVSMIARDGSALPSRVLTLIPLSQLP